LVGKEWWVKADVPGFQVIFETMPVSESFLPKQTLDLDHSIACQLNVSCCPVVTSKDEDPVISVFEEKHEIDEMVCVIKVEFKSGDGAA
jgi:hypothetical protein